MRRSTRLSLVLLLLAAVPVGALAQRKSGQKVKRAPPPEFDAGKTEEYFYSNVFETLVGERPNLRAPAAPAAGGEQPAGGDGGQTVEGWAQLISSETLEDEVKSIKITLDKTITTPGAFRGGGFQECRREFTVAAMLFGIITEYDGDVRFDENASGMRDALARAGHNCKVGTIQAYNESKQRRDDLQTVLSGSPYPGKEGDPDLTWDKICDRSPLMERLDVSLRKRIEPAVSSAAEFKENADDALHEAELISAMAEVLMKEGMEDGDYEDYQEFCKQMQLGASEVVSGAKQNNYEAARRGAGIISQACTTCHENYRG